MSNKRNHLKPNDPLIARRYHLILNRDNSYIPTGLAVAKVINNQEIAYGFSLCHYKDQFRKTVARDKAEGRLSSGKFVVPINSVSNEQDLRKVLRSNLTDKDHEGMINVLEEELVWALQEAVNKYQFLGTQEAST